MELLKTLKFSYEEGKRTDYLVKALLNPEEFFEKEKSRQNWDDGDYPDVINELFKALPDADQGTIWDIAQCDNDALDFIWSAAIMRLHSPLKLLFLKVRLQGITIFDVDAVDIVKERYMQIFDEHNLSHQNIYR
ncbi:hypothetical protein LCGC14_0175420 [marine sediment metagenome]|uniref:Uncharacterized protein n=1 Tax=marine sediment metagenome TaxID=412755 RepID=A0A0F9XTP5_9ZZZZ